jgi:cellulose synthase/poly-beta-1,6-N-acetylglucosamine synthase-like glycosyltransferase
VTAGTPRVSVNIPAYRQLPLARRAIDSVRSQSYPALEITIFDDAASDEYRDYIDSLGDPRLRYHRNAKRLGAMRNMFGAIAGGSGEFTMAFHEDDLLSTTYLEAAMALLRQDATCAFVACQLHEFGDEPASGELARTYSPVEAETFSTARDLLRGILRGVEPMFGSIVYRRSALQGVTADHDRYATLVDRPFLMSIMDAGWTCAVIQSPLVWYRRHGDGDTRHLAMTTTHVLNLLRTYREQLPRDWTEDDRTAFFKYTGYWLFELYRLTPPEQRPPVWRYLLRAWRDGVYSPRARGRLGLRQISRALLNQTS